jgi:hypothetical protein
MQANDRLPLQNATGTALISRHNNNRLGAVYSSLHAFWISRQATLNANGQQVAVARRDAYSLLLFNEAVTTCLTNDFTRSPDELLNSVVQYRAGGGTNYTAALNSTQVLMEKNWSTERYQNSIFGELRPISMNLEPLSLSSCQMASAMLQTRQSEHFVVQQWLVGKL